MTLGQRFPALAIALLSGQLLRVIGAWLLGAPLAGVVDHGLESAQRAALLPSLLKPGAVASADVLRELGPVVSGWAHGTWLPLVLWSVLGIGPLWLTLRALIRRRLASPRAPSRDGNQGTASGELGALTTLALAFGALRLSFCWALWQASSAFHNTFGGFNDPRWGDALTALWVVLGILGWGALRVAADFVYAAVVQRRRSALAALGLGLVAAIRHPLRHGVRAAAAGLLSAAVGLALLSAPMAALARSAAQAVAPSVAFGPHFVRLWLLPQLALLVAASIRAAWLWHVMGAVDREWPHAEATAAQGPK
jgi:hypothetical protein